MKKDFENVRQKIRLFEKESVVVQVGFKRPVTYVTPEGALFEEEPPESFLQNKFLTKLNEYEIKYHVLCADEEKLVFAVPLKSEGCVEIVTKDFFAEGERADWSISLEMHSTYNAQPGLSERIANFLNPKYRAVKQTIRQLKS